jgi:hypothetical protein
MKKELFIDFVFSRRYSWSDKNYRERQSYPTTAKWADVLKDWTSEGDKLRPIRRQWRTYTDLGGYPLFYVTRDNGVLCPACANRNLKLTLGDDPQWRIVDCDVNYEDPELYCDNCSERIESAYAEEEADET